MNFLLRCEVTDARLQGVVVTLVELAGDSARLWFTTDGDDDNNDKTEALDRAAGFLRNRLADSLALKRTPELRFRRDPSTGTILPTIPTPSTNET